KVEAFEAVTTPAGTFECVKITEDVDSKMAFVNTTGKNKSWYAKNIGLVRQEVFDEKGKLLVRQELVKID
ncbi:MAG: hypothetical protein KDD10_13265, partial [Phaeodactylibacter sp.]|nr:hypothetical protein [Phaeodactylibacter sp.]